MATLTTTEIQLAKKLSTAKHPRQALERAVKNSEDGTGVLWRLLAAGAVPFRGPLADAAGCCAEDATLADVWAAAQHLDDSALREESVLWAYGKSYRRHADAWERELPQLPAIARQLVACARHAAGATVAPADREHVLETFAKMAVDKAHTFHHRLQEDAEELGEANAAFAQRVLRHLDRLPADARLVARVDVLEALRFAPWAVLAPLLRGVAASDRRASDLLEVLASRDDAPRALLDALTRADAPLPPATAALVLVRAVAHGEEPPAELDESLVEGLADGRLGQPEHTAAIEALPKARLRKLVAALKATGTEAYACAGLLRDPALDAKIVDELVAHVVDGVAADDLGQADRGLTSTFAQLLAAGEHGMALIDRAFERVAQRADYAAWYWSAHLRLLARRVQFAMTRGRKRRLELVQPGADLDRVDDVRQAIGYSDQPLLGLSPTDIATLLAAWRPYAWDGGLYLDQVFGADLPAPPPIATRPWRELADLVAVTSFRRLAETEALPAVFARDVALADKLALAERIAARANAYPKEGHALAAMESVLAALLPHVVAQGSPLTGELATAATRVRANDPSDAVVELLAKLPAGAWSAPTRTSKPRRAGRRQPAQKAVTPGLGRP